MRRTGSSLLMAAAAALWTASALVTPPVSASSVVAPSHSAVLRLTAMAEEYVGPGGKGDDEHLHQDGKAVVVADGRGGWITAIPAVRWPTADGLGGLVLFWHNATFVGSSSLGTGTNLGREAVGVGIVRAGRNDIVLQYADYKPSDPACCPSLPDVRIHYSWNGARIVASRAVPLGALEKNMTIRL